MDLVHCTSSHQVLSIYEVKFYSIRRSRAIIWKRKKVANWNNSKIIDARVTDLVHDTFSHQDLIIYVVTFQKYK